MLSSVYLYMALHVRTYINAIVRLLILYVCSLHFRNLGPLRRHLCVDTNGAPVATAEEGSQKLPAPVAANEVEEVTLHFRNTMRIIEVASFLCLVEHNMLIRSQACVLLYLST